MFADHTARSTYTDEHIQRWSDVYVEKRVRDYGVHLEFFLINPQPIIDAIENGRMLRLDQMTQPRELFCRSTMMDDTNLHLLLVALSQHIGCSNGISARDLVAEVNMLATDTVRKKLSERELRHAVVALRLQGQHVCAHPKSGYFLAENVAELQETTDWLKHRAISSLQQVAAMEKVSLPDLFGQIHLPT